MTSSVTPPSAQTDRFVHERLPAPEQWPRLDYPLPELVIPDQANLVQALFARARQAGHANRPMLRSDACTLSYAEAQQRVNQIAQLLIEDFQLLPGNRVLLRGGNSIELALAWLGVVQAGLIAVASMPLLRAKELGEIIDKAQPALALCDHCLLDELQTAQAQRGVLRAIVALNGSNAPGTLAALAAQKSGQVAPCPTSADDIALMAFTFGLGGLLLFPMWAGASVYYPSISYTPEAMVQLIKQVGATVCYTAPTFYRQMAPFAKSHGVPDLRLCVSAGEGRPDATRQLWKDASGLEMVDGIGATEMFHIFISSAGDQVRRGAVGQVVPGYSARVVDEHGIEVPRGSLGRLAVIGPTGCRYLGDARQAGYVQDGWNYPGDAFVQDADGYFFYQARADDLIITSGYNVAGPEVEDALLKHPAVAECGVVGLPDEARGMLVKAFVVLKPGQRGDADLAQALQAACQGHAGPFQIPAPD